MQAHCGGRDARGTGEPHCRMWPELQTLRHPSTLLGELITIIDKTAADCRKGVYMVRRASNASNVMIFRTESGSKLARLADTEFDSEHQLQMLIEENIGEVFPGLALLRSEFPLDDGGHRTDTVAFDKNWNTFAVIEYKNRLDDGVIDQAKAYLNIVKKRKAELVLGYTNRRSDAPKKPGAYNWDMYAIIIAPKFSQNQLKSAEDDRNLELYVVKRHDAGILSMIRVSGGRKRDLNEIAASTSAKAPQTQVEIPVLATKALQINQLYDTIRARLLAEFRGAEEIKKKVYSGFRYPGGNYFCTVAVQKSKIWFTYSGKRAASELKPDGFVQDMKGWGIGKYGSNIMNEADFEKALDILKRLRAGSG